MNKIVEHLAPNKSKMRLVVEGDLIICDLKFNEPIIMEYTMAVIKKMQDRDFSRGSFPTLSVDILDFPNLLNH